MPYGQCINSVSICNNAHIYELSLLVQHLLMKEVSSECSHFLTEATIHDPNTYYRECVNGVEMIPIMMNMLSLLAGTGNDAKSSPLNSGKGSKGFLQMLLKLKTLPQQPFVSENKSSFHHGIVRKTPYISPLESLRSNLLNREKSLDKLTVQQQDIHLLKTVLYQSGYSKKDVDPLLESLMDKNPLGDIRLSEFFSAVDTLSAPERKIPRTVILDASAGLDLEYILRTLGVLPEEAEHIIHSAKVADGGFDWDIIVSGLKKYSSNPICFIDPSDQPKLETALKGLGLTPERVERVINSARMENGSLDTGKFILALEEAVFPPPSHIETDTVSSLKTALVDFGLSQNQAERFILALEKVMSDHPSPMETDAVSSLKTALVDLGLSQDQADRFSLNAMLNNKSSDIDKLISRLNKKELFLSDVTETPAIAPLESDLKDFGMQPTANEQVINRSRMVNGRLDSNKLMLELKALENSRGQGTFEAIPISSTQPTFKGPEGVYGTEGFSRAKRGHLTIKDFIAVLEQRTEREAEITPKSTVAKTAVDQLLEKIVIRDDATQPDKVLQSLSKATLKDPLTDRVEFKNKPSTGHSGFKSSSAAEPADGYRETASSEPLKKVSFVENPEHVDRSTKHVDPMAYRHSLDHHSMEIPADMSRSSFSSFLSRMDQTAGERPLPAYLIDQVGRQISRSLLRGQQEFSLQLRPPEMGALRIQMTIHDHTLKLGIIAENNSVRELLLSSIPQLREALMEQGIKLDLLDVEINDGFDPSLAEFKDQSNEGLKRGQNGFQSRHNDVVQNETPEDDTGEYRIPNPYPSILNNQRLDIMA